MKVGFRVRSRSNYLRASFNQFCAAIYLSSGPDSDTNKVKPTDNNPRKGGRFAVSRVHHPTPNRHNRPQSNLEYLLDSVCSLISTDVLQRNRSADLFQFVPKYKCLKKFYALKCTSFNLKSFNLALWTHQLFLIESSGNL